MPTILAISGSLRAKSYNTALLRAAATLGPPGTSIELASIRDVPLYDADLDARHGTPAAVLDLKARIAACDGLLLASPEYNHSVPGVLKNAIDWISRPASDIPRVFGGLPAGIVGVTTGMGGTILGQAAWLPVLRALGTLPYYGDRLVVSGAAKVFDEHGGLQDDTVRAQLGKYLHGFAAFVERHGRRQAEPDA